MSQPQSTEPGIVEKVTEAAAAAYHKVADTVTTAAGAASEKLQENKAAAEKEMHKETVKNPDVPVTERVKAAGETVKDWSSEKKHEAEYEAKKEQLKSQ